MGTAVCCTCLVHMQHRWDLVFRQSVERILCQEALMRLDVPPTLVSFAVDVASENDVVTPEFKKAGNKLVLFSN